MREEFMIHPSCAEHSKLAAAEFDFAAGVQVRQRDVVRRAAWALRLLADAVLAVNHGRLCGLQYDMKRKPFVDGLQDSLIASPHNLPIALPDAPLRLVYT